MEISLAIRAVVDFYLDPFGPLLAAIVQAEGGEEAFVRAIRCSLPKTKDYPEALARGAKTLRHRAMDYQHLGRGPLFTTIPSAQVDPWTGEAHPERIRFTPDFITYLGAWAPVGALNDPTHLNEHWVKNVSDIYTQEMSA